MRAVPILMILSMMFAVDTVSADETGLIAAGVQPSTSNYSKITTLQALTLGSLYYTDPERAKSIEYLNCYDPSIFESDQGRTLFLQLARDGKIQFGKENTIDSALTPMVLKASEQMPEKIKTLLEKLKEQKICVLSTDASLLGSTPSSSFFRILGPINSSK
jgi:hypothetical protein